MRPERRHDGRRRREAPGRWGLEPLEARAVPALIVAPLDVIENIPFSRRIAEFQPTDLQGNPSTYRATVDWGDGRAGDASVARLADGTFGVFGATTYPEAGAYALRVTITGAQDSTASASGPVEVRSATPMVASAVPIRAEVDRPFHGPTVAFSDSSPGASADDYVATIQWDSGDTAVTTGTVVEVSAGRFQVLGEYTYDSAGAKIVKTTIERLSDGAKIEPAYAAQVTTATGVVQPSTVDALAGSPFVGALLRFAPVGDATDYRATIDWGDGTTGVGTIVVPPQAAEGDTSPRYMAVYGEHVYAAPGSYTATVRVETTSAGLQSPPARVSVTVHAFVGGLDPTSLLGTSAGASVTNQVMPIVSGTAAPGSVVSLSMRRLGGGDPVGVASVIVDPSGRWSQTIGPVSGTFLLYGVATPPGGTPTPTTILNGGLPIVVEPHPVRMISATRGPGADRVTVAYHNAGEGRPLGLESPGSYAARLADGRVAAPISVRALPARHGAVVLTFPRGTFPRRGAAILAVAFPGAQDAAGLSADPVLLPIRAGRR